MAIDNTIITGSVIDITTLPTDLKSIKAEPGVVTNGAGHSLPAQVYGPFCQALKAERQGNSVLAEQKLADAVAKEIELAS